MGFWEIIEKILNGDDLSSEEEERIIEYDPEMMEMYNHVITAHASKENDKLTISFFKPEQWEMVLSTSQMLEKDVESIVRGLEPGDVKQLVISSEDWNPEEGLDNFF